MNLKESYRYANFLEDLLDSAKNYLGRDDFVTTTKEDHLRSKANKDAEDELGVVVAKQIDVDFTPNQVIDFIVKVVNEKEKLFTAIADAKSTTEINIDNAISLNKRKQSIISTFKMLANRKPKETQTNADKVIANVRRFGKPTITGDYALISKFNGFAGFQGTTPAVTGISQKVMDEIHSTGLMGMYNGAVLAELPNPYDLTTMNKAGDNFDTMLPAGLGYVIPAGGQSPIYTITRGGLTSFTGTDVTTGQIISRFDLSVGALVAPNREYEIGLLHDQSLDSLK